MTEPTTTKSTTVHSYDWYESLQKDWLLTITSEYSDTERLYWFARTDDQGKQETVKIPAINGRIAWEKLGEHVKNPGSSEPDLNRAARLHQARLIEAQLGSLLQRQEELLAPLMAGLEKLSITELTCLRDELPKSFHRAELQTIINQKSGINPLAGLDISGVKR